MTLLCEEEMQAGNPSDEELWEACRKLPSNWEPYGQSRWHGPAESKTPGMRRNSMRENRETPWLPVGKVRRAGGRTR